MFAGYLCPFSSQYYTLANWICHTNLFRCFEVNTKVHFYYCNHWPTLYKYGQEITFSKQFWDCYPIDANEYNVARRSPCTYTAPKCPLPSSTDHPRRLTTYKWSERMGWERRSKRIVPKDNPLVLCGRKDGELRGNRQQLPRKSVASAGSLPEIPDIPCHKERRVNY